MGDAKHHKVTVCMTCNCDNALEGQHSLDRPHVPPCLRLSCEGLNAFTRVGQASFLGKKWMMMMMMMMLPQAFSTACAEGAATAFRLTGPASERKRPSFRVSISDGSLVPEGAVWRGSEQL